jgi:hypothetical protein
VLQKGRKLLQAEVAQANINCETRHLLEIPNNSDETTPIATTFLDKDFNLVPKSPDETLAGVSLSRMPMRFDE